MSTSTAAWQETNLQKFWAEKACNEHIIQIYENDSAFYNALEGFAGSGFVAGESVIIIATDQHLHELNKRLVHQGFNLNKLIVDDQYLAIDAEDLMDNFIVDGTPDPKRFNKLAEGLLKRARKDGRKVRAFGEMVALLWKDGNRVAAEQLEKLWDKWIKKEQFTLLCAYPKVGLTDTAMKHVCSLHNLMINGEDGPTTQVRHRPLG